ncbi:unnamed protein product [Jaminaea pallidilutea]
MQRSTALSGAGQGSTMGSSNGNGRAGPVNVNDLLKKQADAASFAPKFMSKKQRSEQAEKAKEQEEEHKKRAEEQRRRDERERIERQRQRVAQHEQDHSVSSRNAVPSNRGGSRSAGSTSDRGRGGHHPQINAAQQLPSGPRADRRAMPAPSHPASLASSSTSRADSSQASATLTEAEQEMIRAKYLGTNEKPVKKTRVKPTDKKFNFVWDESDDTTDAINPVFQQIAPISGLRHGGTEALATSSNGNSTRTTSKALQTFSTPAHWSEKSLDDMKERDWRIFREDFGISARGGHIPRPLRSWAESEIPRNLLEVIDHIGYKDPSPIQRQAIPIGLKERDLIGIAETGSGKTASFVIPMLSYISRLPRLDDSNRHLGPYALILAPTRELAQQIQVETSRFTSFLGYNCISIVGGRDMSEQAIEASRGAEIVIATPGRLKDCIDRHIVVLGQCAYVVMDEADRMVNLGFEDELNYILDSLPVSNVKPDGEEAEVGGPKLNENMGVMSDEGQRYRVTMLYSATMPASVDRMARKYLRRPATITIGDANQAVGTVVQTVEFVNGEDKKRARLLQILAAGFDPPIIIFSTTRQSVDALSKDLLRSGWPCTTLHAGKSQDQREEALAALRSGETPILVATDLAGRGIDVPDVSLVINFSMPTMFESYIHRIGRTGRAGKKGHSITFLEAHDEEWYYDLKMEISRSPVSTVPRELERHPAAQQRMTREAIKRKRDGD